MAAFIRSLSIIFLYSLTFASFAAGVDLYEELGLSKTASKAEIKKAYRDLAKKWHPDKSSEENAQEKFMRITKAHEILLDDEKRKHYDFFGSDDIDGSPLGDKEFSFTFGEHTFTFGGSNKPKSKEVLTLQRYQEEILKAAHNKRYIVYVFTEYCYSCKPFNNVWAELETEFTSQGIGYGVFDENLDMRLAAMLGMSTRVAPVIVGICNGNLQWLEDRHLTKESVMQFATSSKFCANTIWKRLSRIRQYALSAIFVVMVFIVSYWFLLSRRSRSTPVEVKDLTCVVLLKLTWETSSTRRALVDINVITRLSNKSEKCQSFSQDASQKYFEYQCTIKEPHMFHDFDLYVKDADGKIETLAQCTHKCPHAIASCSRRHSDDSSNGQWQPPISATNVPYRAPQVSNSWNSPSLRNDQLHPSGSVEPSPSLRNDQSHPSGSFKPDNRPLTNSRYDPLPETSPRRRVNSAERPKNTSQRQETEVANFREVQGGAMRNNLNPVIAAVDGDGVDDLMECEPDNGDNSEDNSLDKAEGGDDEDDQIQSIESSSSTARDGSLIRKRPRRPQSDEKEEKTDCSLPKKRKTD